MVFNCIPPSVVFQEVPNEISLCFSITGCKVGCKGCHSTELWQAENGISLTNQSFMQWLKKYQDLISCVVFFGGEWQPRALIEKLLIAKKFGLKTCLYSGEETDEKAGIKHIDLRIIQHLTFLKTGAWQEALGGLESPITNQIFRNVITGEKLNYLFTRNTFNTPLLTQGASNVAA
ncbi:anaerobic ribonucleoside-triphosphate reductase activating protein [Colwellia sp. 12G3]|uniref:anaerobic ribonucleoside-triphosphate reductase activating protein n=1 Tax=Colwellia sp. 12G3 TaxID=2058299 RepID=UPI000C349017|nr:anaerobic ribonucleoside-triphosphate reductase activating protein [Colwellia sp. 12G3]PKI16355.1 anaerobic ribonucleoside-triphosphate reductase activating protein [Colwellia sp. 12G3]